MTQDNWSDVMRTCMYGCSNHAYDTGLPKFDNLCTMENTGVGWIAPIYFISFMIVSAMVLMSLVVGVIITSMELLREDVNEEK